MMLTPLFFDSLEVGFYGLRLHYAYNGNIGEPLELILKFAWVFSYFWHREINMNISQSALMFENYESSWWFLCLGWLVD